ncbi:MAG: hypothetical protein CVV47_11905 [Spirochaetae bacterium HGW-Spirochaetae-3]|nr:MAG: hypothetical protein CVV47_11905 [Spirochaetae bacterium HGW-Spirochaetae-3]
MNVRIFRIAAGAAALAGLVSLASCQQFFTGSLAKALARDSYTIPSDISMDDAVELLAGGDADVAAALVSPLSAAVSAGTPGTASYDEAATALVTAVVLSSDASPAIFSIVEELGTSGLDVLSPEQVDSAIASLMAISLTPGETAALLLVSDDAAAPSGLAPDQLYVAALTLAVDAFNDAGVAVTSYADLSILLDTGTNPAAVDDATIAGAIALLALAQAAETASGTTSIFGQLLSGMSFE